MFILSLFLCLGCSKQNVSQSPTIVLDSTNVSIYKDGQPKVVGDRFVPEIVVDTMRYDEEYQGNLKYCFLQSLANERIILKSGQDTLLDSIFQDLDPSIGLLYEYSIPPNRNYKRLVLLVNGEVMQEIPKPLEKKNRIIFVKQSGRYVFLRETRKGDTVYK